MSRRIWRSPVRATGMVGHGKSSRTLSVRPLATLKPAAQLLLSPFTRTMKIRSLDVSRLPRLFAARFHAQVSDAVRALKVLPAPKEVRIAEGRIVIKPSTTILISNSLKTGLRPKLCRTRFTTAPV